ncbi:MAG: ABC transporter ATP-binding protein/permease [Gordonia sp. (in: high G+C Gram-positive bacteria)]|uniref:ABC transporter ATP-binding protein/permease n=1 Tax=Gordonia sp. (in: high G+C Gram-positive bacteria) TaxID=84139 RepID=UPI0039E325DE
MTTGRDWGNELQASIVWVLWVSAVCFVAMVVVCFLLVKFTKWGQQFWRVAGNFFTERESAPLTWTLIIVLLIYSIFAVRLNVLFTYQSLDMYNSLQAGSAILDKSKGDGLSLAERIEPARTAFWTSLKIFGVLATIYILRGMSEWWIGAAFDIRMRAWLTSHISQDWLGERAFYRNRFIEVKGTSGETTMGPDNPDQRIEEDIENLVYWTHQFVFGRGGGASGVIPAAVTMITFTGMLWGLSGPLDIFGYKLGHAMVFLLMMFIFVATVVAVWLGRPLIRLTFLKFRLSANFRFGLVRVRENAENIALYSGEQVEQRNLMALFRAVVKNYWAITYRQIMFNGWNWGVGQVSNILPWVIQAGRFFTGQVTLGQLSQTAGAFGNLSDSLSFFRDMYDDFARWRASIIRLDGLQKADKEARELPVIATVDGPDEVVLEKVTVDKPNGELLIKDLSLKLVPGDALVVKGGSGTGKTTLFRALSGLWPYCTGTFIRPGGTDTLFLSQVPYLPLTDLRAVLTYPAPPSGFSDDELKQMLVDVSLPHLVDRLGEDQDWSKVLSPGEQQRIAFARVLLSKPKVVFLDEASSALDEGLEYSLYHLVRTRLPETILLSISHRPATEQHHTKELVLRGKGAWELSDIPAKV